MFNYPHLYLIHRSSLVFQQFFQPGGFFSDFRHQIPFSGQGTVLQKTQFFPQRNHFSHHNQRRGNQTFPDYFFCNMIQIRNACSLLRSGGLGNYGNLGAACHSGFF